ncbi:hypothetical protein KCP75_02105 [Salmonella enterica subsp. enterica]|nr:hypothetical protein KCP75_02105 [Salmonella enterica subsp. enterica]
MFVHFSAIQTNG